jgi:NADPH2 dehydrogenase
MADLLSPLYFSSLSLRNRIVMPPMWSAQALPDGRVTDKIVEYHRVRAAAGCGLIIVEHSFISPGGRHTPTQIGVYSDDMIEGLSRLAAAIKSEGSTAALQISHAGSRVSSQVLVTAKPVAPSAVHHPYEAGGEIPVAISREQTYEIAQDFAAAAGRAQKAGFDAVEIHAAHGFLLSSFLSPLTNQRQDEYGGSVENRSRIHQQVLEAVRRKVGNDYPVFVRLGAHDETPGGLELEDACWTAARLAANGAALIDVSGGLQGSRGVGKTQGYFVPYAAAIKKRVDVPVLVTGGFREPAFADRVVREGDADLVGIGRAMLEDPEWARKALAALSYP